MNKIYENLKEKNLIKRFISHGVPVEIYYDDESYTPEQAAELRCQFFMTLAGIDVMPLSRC